MTLLGAVGIKNNKKARLLRIAPVIASASIFAVLILIFKDKLSGSLLNYRPHNLFLAAVIILIIYAVKSFSVVFPLLALYASAGKIFSLPYAILINFLGIAICIALPYYIGRLLGKEAVEELIAKNKNAAKINNFKTKNALYFCYILRIINILPGDIVSLMLGAGSVDAKDYFLGSMLGLLPTMIATTFAGEAILHPFSAEFLTPFTILIAISLLSMLIYKKLFNKKY